MWGGGGGQAKKGVTDKIYIYINEPLRGSGGQFFYIQI